MVQMGHSDGLSSRDKNLTNLNDPVGIRIEGLLQWFRSQGSVLVALSGGVDSSVVAALAKMALDDKAVAVTVKSSTLSASDLKAAMEVVGVTRIRHIIVANDELTNPKVAENTSDRCYYCRSELVAVLRKIALSEGAATLVDGTNADDLNVHRPGILAMKEGGVRSPLAENGFTKLVVREIAATLHLPNSEEPSNACLASRIPYGQRITPEGLKKVAESEEAVKEIAPVRQLRVRHHGEIARIEVDRDEMGYFFDEAVVKKIVERLKLIGFKYVTLDIEGYRSGSMDEILSR